MELKSYARILLRRWRVVVILPLLVGIIAVYQEATRTPNHSAEARLSVIRIPDEEIPGEYQYDEYYAYLSSEFALDDLVETVEGNVFARGVAARLQNAGISIRYETVQSSLTSDRRHRVLSVMAASTDRDLALEIASAAAAELEENTLAYFGPNDEGDVPAFVRIIEQPVETATDTQRARLVLLLGIVVALGAGILLAFVVEYLDDRLYDVDTAVYETELPHLATIPGERT